VRLLHAIALASTAIAGGLHAQQTQPRKGATLIGVAVDSIRGGYLRGATIFVSGTTLSAMSDSVGRFRLYGIPAGSHVIEVQHPFLDSLGLALTTSPQTFTDGDSSTVMLSVPSAPTYAARMCSVEERAGGAAVVVGTVIDAGSENPSTGAKVNVSWIDYVIGKKSISSQPRWRTATVAPSGVFRICGLPDDVSVAAVASRGNDSTASVNVDLRNVIGTVALKLPASGSTAFMSGRVLDANGKPAQGARVAIESDEATSFTGQDGAFALRNLRPGTRRLTIRKIGFEPVERAVEIPRDGLSDVSFSLGKSVAVLKSIVVRARQDFGLQRIGFTERQKKRPGAFFTPKEIELRNGPSVKDLLRSVPIMRRPGCIRYFIDGFVQPQTTDPDEFLSGAEIGAVEVYGTGFVPPEFFAMTFTGMPCKSVVIWTKWKLR
jgi:hypothetical protein